MEFITIPIKKFIGRLNGLNVILAVTTLSLTAYSSANWFIRPTISSTQQKSKTIAISEIKMPAKKENVALNDYAEVAAKNIFRPDRSEYLPPPPPKKPVTPPRRNLPKPELLLNGVITTGENNGIAMISGYYFTEKSRVNISYQKYHKGDSIGYYKLIEVGRKMVILEDDYSKDKITLSLKFSSYKSSPKSSSTTKGKNILTTPTTLVTEEKRIDRELADKNDKYIPNGKRSKSKTGGGNRVEIPAVYVGGKAYYPKNGSPVPSQNISGATISIPSQHISGR